MIVEKIVFIQAKIFIHTLKKSVGFHMASLIVIVILYSEQCTVEYSY